MGNSLQGKFESELAIFAARLQSSQKIMMERYRVKALSIGIRGADPARVVEYFKEDSGRLEWDAMVKESKKAAGAVISRAADLGYFVGFGHGK